MKILTILGSARKHGNTATVLAEFECLAARDHQVERINITDYRVNGCLGCNHCQKVFDEPGCAQKDDGPVLLARILDADLVVYASPLYAWSFTAQLKALFDRLFCLVKWDAQPVKSLIKDRRAALLVTCADAIENNADLIQVMFQREMDCAQCAVAGMYIVPHCTTPKEMGDKATRTAEEMAREIF
jgi:multimeric flavodoxin WrbA